MTPPLVDTQTEFTVIATVLRDANAIVDLPAEFVPETFSLHGIKNLYRAALEIVGDGDVPTVPAVKARLGSRLTAEINLMLATCSERVPLTPAELAASAENLIALHRRRKYLDLANRLSLSAQNLDKSLSDTEAEHERALFEVDAKSEPDTITAYDVARGWITEAEGAMLGTSSPELPTGIPQLDAVLHINPTDLVLLGGRPANGKSVVALQIARSVAGRGLPVLFVGLEMHAKELHRRLLRMEAGAYRHEVIKPANVDQYSHIAGANDRLSRLPIEFASDPDVDVMLRTAARMKRKRGLALLIVDYIQRARSSKGDPRANRDTAIGDVAQRLKDFAARYETPVLAVASLSRQSSGREDPRPRLEDLRESGRLEYEANSVVFVHLPFKSAGTNENEIVRNPTATEADKSEAKRRAQIMVAKQRDAEDSSLIEARAEFEFARLDFDTRARGEQDTMGFPSGRRRHEGGRR